MSSCSTSTLPDGDGLDVCRELRRSSAVPIIMLTARGTVTDRVVGLELGADDYVVKPFATGEVISRIRAVLRRTASAPAALAARPGSRRRAAPGPRRPARLAGRAGADAHAQGVRPARAPGRGAGAGRHPRDADVRRLGRELVRLDQDARRPHRGAAAQARRRPVRAALHRDGPRRRLPHGRRRPPEPRTRAPADRPAGGARLRAAAGDRRARHPARAQPADSGQRRGPLAGPGAGRSGRRDRLGSARAGAAPRAARRRADRRERGPRAGPGRRTRPGA